jgi:PhoH-like ATPase
MIKEVRKIFVVDTSLLLHDPTAILNFQDNIVVIPFPVLEELDSHKHKNENGTAMYARQAIRILDELREKGAIHRGVETPGKGILLVDNEGFVPNDLNLKVTSTDNFIISVALKWKFRQEWIQKKKKRDVLVETSQRFALGEVYVITKDINLRVKAGACGIAAQDYLKDRVVESQTKLYSGTAHINVDDLSYKTISKLLCTKEEAAPYDAIANLVELPKLLPNQCCIFSMPVGNEEKTQLAIHKEYDGKPPYFRHVQKPKNLTGRSNAGNGIEPRNIAQSFALALLMDETVQIVTLSGIAGSGKTLMALLAGLKQLGCKRYEEILVYRSNTEIGEPLGFLKGTLKQKFSPWAIPIHDILDLLDTGEELEIYESDKKKRKFYEIDTLLLNGKIQIAPINHVRGRSFHWKYVVVDETQNFKPGDIKKVITRVGKGAKIVLTGDIEQIDNLYLDAVSNGLSHVIEHMKGQPMFGHVTLEKSERSELAEIAAKLL